MPSLSPRPSTWPTRSSNGFSSRNAMPSCFSRHDLRRRPSAPRNQPEHWRGGRAAAIFPAVVVRHLEPRLSARSRGRSCWRAARSAARVARVAHPPEAKLRRPRPSEALCRNRYHEKGPRIRPFPQMIEQPSSERTPTAASRMHAGDFGARQAGHGRADRTGDGLRYGPNGGRRWLNWASGRSVPTVTTYWA